MHTLAVLISLTAYIPTDAKCSYNRCHIDLHKKLFLYRQNMVLCNKLLQNNTKNKILVIILGWAGVVGMVTRLLDGEVGNRGLI